MIEKICTGGKIKPATDAMAIDHGDGRRGIVFNGVINHFKSGVVVLGSVFRATFLFELRDICT